MRDLSDKSIKEDCPHCRLGSFALEYPLFETANFRIICDVHPLTEGHILIMPKSHLSCIGAFSAEIFNEFQDIYKHVQDFIKSVYGKVATFEHGVFGQTVYHSHVHVLPFPGIVEQIIPEGKQHIKPINLITKLTEEFKNNGGYLFFTLNDHKYLVDKNLVQPRFFRDRFAMALGRQERGDWKATRQNSNFLEEMKIDILNLVNKWNQYQKHLIKV